MILIYNLIISYIYTLYTVRFSVPKRCRDVIHPRIFKRHLLWAQRPLVNAIAPAVLELGPQMRQLSKRFHPNILGATHLIAIPSSSSGPWWKRVTPKGITCAQGPVFHHTADEAYHGFIPRVSNKPSWTLCIFFLSNGFHIATLVSEAQRKDQPMVHLSQSHLLVVQLLTSPMIIPTSDCILRITSFLDIDQEFLQLVEIDSPSIHIVNPQSSTLWSELREIQVFWSQSAQTRPGFNLWSSGPIWTTGQGPKVNLLFIIFLWLMIPLWQLIDPQTISINTATASDKRLLALQLFGHGENQRFGERLTHLSSLLLVESTIKNIHIARV